MLSTVVLFYFRNMLLQYYVFTGWHRRLNGLAGRANIQFYILVPLLRREAEMVTLQTQQVIEAQSLRRHTTRSRRIHASLEELWDRYDDEDIITSDFLRRVGAVYATCVPGPTSE